LCVFVIMVQGYVVMKENIDVMKTLIKQICMRKNPDKTKDKTKVKKISHSIILNPEFLKEHKLDANRRFKFKQKKKYSKPNKSRSYIR